MDVESLYVSHPNIEKIFVSNRFFSQIAPENEQKYNIHCFEMQNVIDLLNQFDRCVSTKFVKASPFNIVVL